MSSDTKSRPTPPRETVEENDRPKNRPTPAPERRDRFDAGCATGWLSLRKPKVNLHWHRRYGDEGETE